MLNYILAIIIYAVFFILIIVFKINPKPEKKTVSLSIAIPFFSIIFQIVSEWIIYMILYIFSDSRSFYFTGGFLIDFIELLLPFFTILMMAEINGCREKIGLALGIASVFIVTSLCIKYIVLNGYWDINAEETFTDLIENESAMEAVSTGKELEVFSKVLIVINAFPAIILSAFMIIKSTGKNRLPEKKK